MSRGGALIHRGTFHGGGGGRRHDYERDWRKMRTRRVEDIMYGSRAF